MDNKKNAAVEACGAIEKQETRERGGKLDGLSIHHLNIKKKPPQDDLLTVRANVDLRAITTGVIIPAGTIGKVLSADRETFIVDFGLATVHRLPRNTHLVQVSL